MNPALRRRSLRKERSVARLSAVFGGVATLRAVIGLYGVMAYAVLHRKREFTLRLRALLSNVIAMVMREALPLIRIGLAGGIALAPVLAGLIRSH